MKIKMLLRSLFKVDIDGRGRGQERRLPKAGLNMSRNPVTSVLVMMEGMWINDAHLRSRPLLGPLVHPPPPNEVLSEL